MYIKVVNKFPTVKNFPHYSNENYHVSHGPIEESHNAII